MKKAFSLSFAFHLVVIVTVGSIVAGFHQEIQRSQEQLITVNSNDLLFRHFLSLFRQ